MVTAKRSQSTDNSFAQGVNVGVGVLERPVNVNTQAVSTQNSTDELEIARANMRRNLDMLLNYDKPTEATATVVEETVQESTEQVVMHEDDYRPTITTMQFGDVDPESIQSKLQTQEEEKKQYRLTGKGLIAVVMYALTVVVVLALIILNTGIISSLDKSNADSFATLNEKKMEYQMLSSEIDSISNNDYVIDKATEMGMIQK